MKKFKLCNIKSFENSDTIEIKPITVFVGKNSCGKSSLLRFPVVLGQSFKNEVIAPLLLFGTMIDYGNYDDIVHNHQDAPIGFEIEYGKEVKSYMQRYSSRFSRNFYENSLAEFDSVILKVTISKQDKKMVVDCLELFVQNECACRINKTSNGKYKLMISNIILKEKSKKENFEFESIKIIFERFIPTFDDDDVIKEYVSKSNEIENKEEVIDRFVTIFGRPEIDASDEKLLKILELHDSADSILSLFRALKMMINRFSSELSYIGPFRENPKRTYRDSESSYNDVGVRGENVSSLLRQDAQSEGILLNEVSNWFSDAMKVKLDIKDIGSSLFSVVVKTDDSKEDNIIDTGYGISQVLPIVAQLYNSDALSLDQNRYLGVSKKNFFVIEQPELHLHPAAQAQLADLFVNNVIKNKTRKILIETHSEHLIRKLQVMIADKSVGFCNDQIAIYYVDKDNNNNSITKRMNISENGQFEEEWPSGFFDKSYELTKLLLRVNSKS